MRDTYENGEDERRARRKRHKTSMSASEKGKVLSAYAAVKARRRAALQRDGRGQSEASGVRLVAHRVVKDSEAPSALDPARLSGFRGAELDLRCNEDGALIVRHAPLFTARSGRRAHEFDAVLGALDAAPWIDTLFLDIKTPDAAEAAAARCAGLNGRFDCVFAVWGGDEARILRAACPDARIFYVAAPIFLDRAPRGALRDLYLVNRFPFLRRASGYKPCETRRDRHNINVKLISADRLMARLPRAADGLCVHRILHSPRLAAFAEKRALSLALYGYRSRLSAHLEGAAAGVDFAIAAMPRHAEAGPLQPDWLSDDEFDDAAMSHA